MKEMRTMQRNRKMTPTLIAAVVAVCAWTATAPAVDMPDNMCVVVTRDHVTNYDQVLGALGAYGYAPDTGMFYTAVFGSGRNIRAFDPCGGGDPAGTYVVDNADGRSWRCAYASDLERVSRSPDIPAGETYADWGGSFNTSSLILNPAPVTYNGISYGTGELAIMSATSERYPVFDPSPYTLYYEYTKRFMTYDLRAIGSPTTAQPDYDNADNGVGTNIGAAGQVDWNDCFTSLGTLQELADTIGISPIGVTDNLGRQVCWADDASAVYFVATRDPYGGVWRIDMSGLTGPDRVVRMIADVTEPVYNYCEPHAIHTNARDFTGGAVTGQQVLFCGTTTTGNYGGINALVDDGSLDPNVMGVVYNVLDGSAFFEFIELTDPNYADPAVLPKVFAITSDPDRNLYFYSRGPGSVYRYDTRGRLLCVRNAPQNKEFYRAQSSTSNYGEALRLQCRMVPNPNAADPNSNVIPQLTFMGTGNKCVGGIYCFTPMDFDRDGQVTVADTEFFKVQINATRDGVAPLSHTDAGYLDYVKCDLNGSSVHNEDRTGIVEACVTTTDMEVLYTFLPPGDTNFDGQVNLVDFVRVTAAFDPLATDKTWADGDFDFDSDVDWIDWVRFFESWLTDVSD